MSGKIVAPDARAPGLIWRSEITRRLRTLWMAKALATTLGITAFFIAYFWVLHHPLSDVTILPLTALDRLISFWPGALPLYFSLWIYVSLAPALLLNARELASYGLAALLMSVVGLTIFLVWPTAVPVFDIDWSLYPSISFLKGIDAAANACPSLHVAFAVFTAMWFEHILRQTDTGPMLRMLNWLWCLGILYSTIATRQHIVIDVVAGAILGGGVAALSLRALRPGRGTGGPPVSSYDATALGQSRR